jgi:hypothetical protein
MRKGPVFPSLIVAAGCLAGLLALQVGCGGTRVSPLPGAVYAKVVPAYPEAKYIGSVGGASSASLGAPASAHSQSWFFKTTDPADKIVSFYKKKLRDAKIDEDGVGETSFTLIPPGAEKGEYVQVIVRKGGDIQIRESLKPEKKSS